MNGVRSLKDTVVTTGTFVKSLTLIVLRGGAGVMAETAGVS